eukprot:SAG31_NODE_12824_length_914_cov_0.839264_1_plen_174_part_10
MHAKHLVLRRVHALLSETSLFFVAQCTSERTVDPSSFLIAIANANCELCPELEAPYGGSITRTHGTAQGSIATYSCEDDVVPENAERTCQPDASWSGEAPSCGSNCWQVVATDETGSSWCFKNLMFYSDRDCSQVIEVPAPGRNNPVGASSVTKFATSSSDRIPCENGGCINGM